MRGVKLTSVASKVLTQSGRLMVEALIDGQRDPAELAKIAKGKLAEDPETDGSAQAPTTPSLPAATSPTSTSSTPPSRR